MDVKLVNDRVLSKVQAAGIEINAGCGLQFNVKGKGG